MPDKIVKRLVCVDFGDDGKLTCDLLMYIYATVLDGAGPGTFVYRAVAKWPDGSLSLAEFSKHQGKRFPPNQRCCVNCKTYFFWKELKHFEVQTKNSRLKTCRDHNEEMTPCKRQRYAGS